MANSAPRNRKPFCTPYLRLLDWRRSDGELIRFVRDGSLQGRISFFERFGCEVMGLVRALVGPSTGYAALAEKSLLEAYRQVYEDEHIQNLSALVHKVTVGVVRRYQWQAWLLGWFGFREDPFEGETDHYIRILFQELQTLPPGERLALCLHHIARRAPSDSAILLGCSTTEVGRRLRSAEARLEPAIKAYLPAAWWAADLDGLDG